MQKNRYLVSGIGPGRGGVGALMENIEPVSRELGFRVVVKWNRPSLRKLVKKRYYYQCAIVIARSLINELKFQLTTRLIKRSKVVFIHPQTAGFNTLFRLARKNEVFLYVMDNSFFCIRSYNFHPTRKKECIQCVGDPEAADIECRPFPIPMSRSKNLRFVRDLVKIAPDLTFLCQNYNQSKLVKEHFGENTRAVVIGMNTGELGEWSPSFFQEIATSSSGETSFILFHGSATEPKGIAYVIRLAGIMPHRSFVIPASEDELRKFDIPENVVCVDVTWKTGLRELTQKAALVVNPSMWSAPIEGALIKSLAYNRNVATVKTMRGYESEIPKSVGLLTLPLNVTEAATRIDEFLQEEEKADFSLQARIEWLESMKGSNGFEHFISKL